MKLHQNKIQRNNSLHFRERQNIFFRHDKTIFFRYDVPKPETTQKSSENEVFQPESQERKLYKKFICSGISKQITNFSINFLSKGHQTEPQSAQTFIRRCKLCEKVRKTRFFNFRKPQNSANFKKIKIKNKRIPLFSDFSKLLQRFQSGSLGNFICFSNLESRRFDFFPLCLGRAAKTQKIGIFNFPKKVEVFP